MDLSDSKALRRLWSNYLLWLRSPEGWMGQEDPPPSWLPDLAGKLLPAVSGRAQFCSIPCLTELLECPPDMTGGFCQST